MELKLNISASLREHLNKLSLITEIMKKNPSADFMKVREMVLFSSNENVIPMIPNKRSYAKQD